MKKRLVFWLVGLIVTSALSFGIAFTYGSIDAKANVRATTNVIITEDIAETIGVKNYCQVNHISFSLVKAVYMHADSKDLTMLEIAEYFNKCIGETEFDCVEPVDAIMSLLGCSFEEALNILDVSSSIEL